MAKAKKPTTIERFQNYKRAGGEDFALPMKLPHGVFIGVVREGRKYKVVELYIDGMGKKVVEHEPMYHGVAVAKATDRLEDLCWRLNQQPWTEEELKWKPEKGRL